jgi:hypothetical protein
LPREPALSPASWARLNSSVPAVLLLAFLNIKAPSAG